MNQGLDYEVAAVMDLAVRTGLFSSLCTVQQPGSTLSASGQPSTTYANVTGLVNIRCMDAVPSTARISATESKEVPDVAAMTFRHVMLDAYYPDIVGGNVTGTGKGWRALISDRDSAGKPVTGTTVTYDLIGAEPDSQNTQTRLTLRLVTL